MKYEIETKEGKKIIEGLMYSSVKDSHGKVIREGDIVHVREYQNIVWGLREEELEKSFGTKDRKQVYDAFTRDDIKGELRDEYDVKVTFEDCCFCMTIIRVQFGNEKVGCGFGMCDNMAEMKDMIPLYDLEIIERPSL